MINNTFKVSSEDIALDVGVSSLSQGVAFDPIELLVEAETTSLKHHNIQRLFYLSQLLFILKAGQLLCIRWVKSSANYCIHPIIVCCRFAPLMDYLLLKYYG